MITWQDKTISRIICYGKEVSEVYLALHLVFASVHSCFGAGYWINTLGWDDNDVWKD